MLYYIMNLINLVKHKRWNFTHRRIKCMKPHDWRSKSIWFIFLESYMFSLLFKNVAWS
jgi:hypothetical protein